MRLILASAISALLVVPALTPDAGFLARAHAHGGSYRGPGGEVPPDSREPTDPPPPGDPNPPQTPGSPDGPDGPTTPGGNPDGPSTPDDGPDGPGRPGDGGSPPTGPSNPNGPITGPNGRRRGPAKGPGYEDWTFWWNFNKDGILQLQSAVLRSQRGTRSGGFVHGPDAGASGGGAVVVATDGMIRNRIVPALRAMLADDDLNFDIQSAAALGLAKIGDTTIGDTLKRMARNERGTGGGARRAGYHRVVRESAALAFGLLQNPTEDTQQFLIELLQDETEQGSFVRPFAAVSLGLLGVEGDTDGAGRATLLATIARKNETQDVRTAAFTGLGLLASPELVPPLLHVVREGRLPGKASAELSHLEVAHAVQALGRMGQVGGPDGATEVVDALLDAIELKRRNKTDRLVRYSAVIALGRLAPQTEPELQSRILAALRRNVNSNDAAPAERNFALIALGRIGATKGVSDELRDDAIAVLRHALRDASPKTIVRPYAALGLGLIGRALRQEGRPSRPDDINEPLREAFDDARNPRARGAYAIASGLVGDKLAIRGLVDVLEDQGTDAKLRGYSAVALGLLGAQEARAAVARVLANETQRDLRLQAATAAGLIGDQGVIGSLVEILKSGDESQYVLGSVALALGRIGDHTSIDPLLAIAQDEQDKYPDLTQALATVALGQIGDRRELPTLARVAEDVNYRALVPALIELLSIL